MQYKWHMGEGEKKGSLVPTPRSEQVGSFISFHMIKFHANSHNPNTTKNNPEERKTILRQSRWSLGKISYSPDLWRWGRRWKRKGRRGSRTRRGERRRTPPRPPSSGKTPFEQQLRRVVASRTSWANKKTRGEKREAVGERRLRQTRKAGDEGELRRKMVGGLEHNPKWKQNPNPNQSAENFFY